MIDLQNKTVLVTGSSSMIGSAVIKALEKRKAIIHPAQHSFYNLLSFSDTQQLFIDVKPEYVVHCAGWNGGIEWNRTFPADIFFRTSKMALNVLTCAADMGVKKTLSIISSCALPDKGEEILKAENLWDGLPNPTVECHGLSKRMLHAYSKQLNKQFGLNAVCGILTNCYGPKDSFHPKKTKVVGALIRKIVEAKAAGLPEIVCWGTGSPRRELMFSFDAGEALVQTLEKYDNVETPICLGTGTDITIKELTEAIAKEVGYTGEIKWDTTKADGQMRKLLDHTAMAAQLAVEITPIEVGLQHTIKWYTENKDVADNKS